MWQSILLVFSAALFKAVADTLTHHFDSSIFKKKNPNWWHPPTSANKVKYLPFTKYRPDAWHLANSAVIFSLIGLWFFTGEWWGYFVLGGWFIVVFNVFYNKILR